MQVKSTMFCRMLQVEHSAIILLTFIKLPFVIRTFILSFFEWLFYTGLTVMVIEEGNGSMVELLTEDPEDAGWSMVCLI